MQNFLYISYYAPPMGMAGSVRAAKICKYIKETKINPILLTCSNRTNIMDKTLEEDIRGIMVLRVFDPLFSEPYLQKSKKVKVKIPILPDGKKFWATRAYKKALEIYKKYPYKVVYATSPPLSSLYLGASLKTRLGVKLFFEFRDHWLILKRRGLEKNILANLFKKADRFIYVHKGIKRSFKRDGEIIEHGYEKIQRKKEDNIFTIFLSGTLKGGEKTFEKFIEVYKKINGVKLKIAGPLSYLLQKRIAKLPGVLYLGFLPHKNWLSEIGNSDCFLILIDENIDPNWVPSKFFEYSGSSIPILSIGRKNSYLKELIEERSKGIYLSVDKIEKVEHILQKWKKNPSYVLESGIPWQKSAIRIKKLIEKCL